MEHDRELDHYSDQARAECEVCSLRAERDRLRAPANVDEDVLRTLDADALIDLIAALRREFRQVERERDRLRTVVDALRPTAEAVVADGNPDDDDYTEGNLSAWTFVLRQLDGVATDGDHDRELDDH